MSDSSVKTIRKQLRNVCQELLPTVLKSELYLSIQKELSSIVNKRLDAIDAYVRDQLKEIQDRSIETQSYVVRNMALAQVKTAPSKVDDSTISPPSS